MTWIYFLPMTGELRMMMRMRKRGALDRVQLFPREREREREKVRTERGKERKREREK